MAFALGVRLLIRAMPLHCEKIGKFVGKIRVWLRRLAVLPVLSYRRDATVMRSDASAYWRKHVRKWIAVIGVDSKVKYIGCLHDYIGAAKACDEAAMKYHGEFASLNFLIKRKNSYFVENLYLTLVNKECIK